MASSKQSCNWRRKDHQQPEAEGKTTPITISDEERPTEEQPTDTEQPRQARPEDEPPVQINEETIALTEEQLQANDGTKGEVAANQPVETGESDTGNGPEPGMEEEQREPEGSGEEASVQQERTRVDEPEQQPIQPEIERETGTEQQIGEAPLDSFEQSLLDILEEE